MLTEPLFQHRSGFTGRVFAASTVQVHAIPGGQQEEEKEREREEKTS